MTIQHSLLKLGNIGLVPVRFLDLKAAYDELRSEVDEAVLRVVRSGQYILGHEVASFESAFALHCEANHCIGTGNGLDALHLILRALNVGQGDEVIVSSNTFIATWLAVTMVGARPVPVEPNSATFNLDPQSVEAALTPKTRVILPTHLYGQAADLDPLTKIAREHGLALVADAAQAHGARYKGRRLGAYGDAVAWSFYPGKNLGALGDGGAVTTNDAALAERVRVLGNNGSKRKYMNEVRGYNSRLDPLQAAVLAVKLRYLDAWNERRRAVAARYVEGLAESGLTLSYVPSWAEPVWHLFVVRSPDRNALAGYLAEKGIETLVHYPVAPHLQQAYADLGLARGSLPIAEQLAGEVLSLPMGPHLCQAEIDEVCEAIQAISGPRDAA